MPESSSDQPPTASLFDAIETGNAGRVAELIAPLHFTLFDVTEQSTEDESAALTAEMDDFPVLVAFTSEAHAGDFAGAMPELFDEGDDIPAFVMDGGTMLAHMPEGFGVLINPETDDCYVMPPDLVDAVVAELSESGGPED